MAILSRRAFSAGLVTTSVATIASAQSIQGQRYGVVELGASGVKTAALEFATARFAEPALPGNPASQGGAYERYQRNEITSFSSNPVVRERSQVTQAANAVAAALATLTDEFRVPRSNIVVVASSSVAALPHRPDIEAAFRARGITLNFVTAAEEAEYGYRWIVLRHRWTQAALSDIGSGNTKGGYIAGEPGRYQFQPYEIAEGSRTLAARASASATHPSEAWNQALVEAAQANVSATAAHMASINPGLAARPRHYLIGGVAWALASLMHPEASVDEASQWVALDPRDIGAFREEVFDETAFNNSGLQRRLNAIASSEAQVRARELVEQVQDAIAFDQLKAGAQILAVLSQQFRLRDKALFFSKEGLYAWPTMYLLARLGIEAPA